MRLIIAGDRRFRDYEKLCSVMNELYAAGHWPTEIISGGAKGADTLGERWAEEHHVHMLKFPANWDKFGKGAGHIRNKQMADYVAARGDGALLAFRAEGSKGTQNMIDTATKTGCIKVIVVDIEIPEETK